MTISFIEQRPSGFYLRYTIPKHQQHLLSYRQLRYSLHNPSKRLAVKVARAVVSRIEVLLAATERNQAVLDDQTIRDTIRRYVLEEQSRLSDGHLIFPPKNENEHEITTDFIRENLGHLRAVLAISKFDGDERFPATTFTENIELEVCKLFRLDPTPTNTASLEFKRACREWTRATSELWTEHLQRLDGQTGPSEPSYLSGAPVVRVEPIASIVKPQGPRIKSQLEPFIDDRNAGRPMRENTADAYRGHVRAFTDVLGDLPVDEVSYETATQLRDTLLKLPKNRNKKKEYRDLTVKQLLKLDIPDSEKLQGRTVGEIIAALKTLFDWLKVKRLLEVNPFDGVIVASNSQSYASLSPTDLTTVFTSELYQPGTHPLASQWWLPLLSLHTGARPSELLQMRLDDITTVDGILCASVVDDADTGQQVKTQAGIRTFPIHPLLLELGFAEYIEELRGSEHDRVLHGIPLGNRKAGDQAGKWWNERYRVRHLHGFKEQRKTLYSFRHTFVTHALNVADIELPLVQQIVGHEKSQMGATKHYDKGATMTRLFDELSKVNFKLPPIKRV